MKDETIGYIVLVLVLIGVGAFLHLQTRDADGPGRRWTGPIPALPAFEELDIDMEKVALGRRLYHDGILSGDGSLSCASCHALDAGGAEPRRTSFGIENAVGPINAPTTFNAWNHVAQFWDGRAADLQEQAGGPVENPIEMGATFEEVVPRIEADDWYTERFADLYPDDGVTKETITDAIAEYERSLITPAPFDAWVQGDDTAMSEEAVAGYRLFVRSACTSCHQGPSIGGTMFQKMGVVNDYFALRGGDLTEADLGRFNHTGEEGHRHFFKVPTLRNVALTAPYFHDGSETDLGRAVRTMGHVQLGLELDDAQVASMVAFLEALTGEVPAHAVLPAEEVPPERLYLRPLPYDVQVTKRLVDGRTQFFAGGLVPSDESKAALVALLRRRFRGVNVDYLVVHDGATFETPETFDAALTQVATAFGSVSQGRAQFDFDAADGPTLRFAGEADEAGRAAVTELMSTPPEGFAWAAPIALLDFDAANACDAALAQLQAETRLEFQTGSAELSEQSVRQLSAVPNLIGLCPDTVRLQVAGHTDNVGDSLANLGLSRRRAGAVVDVLVANGIAPARLVARGYGDAQPVGDNATPEGRADNRRIELSLDRGF